MTKTVKSTKGTKGRGATSVHVLGRSAATGRYVFAPVVTDRSVISRKAARRAVEAVTADVSKRGQEIEQKG